MNTYEIKVPVYRTTLLLLVSTLMTAVAHAQSPSNALNFPVRAPKMIVPFSPGGISDFLARVVAEGVQEHIGHPMVIENRPGAGGNIGLELLARSPADGYTLGLATVGFASNSVLYARVPFDPIKDFAPVIKIGTVPSVIVVHPSLQVATLKEFIDLARRHPGELTFGSSGMGTGSHLAVELFKVATNTQMTHVPYKSTAQAVPDLLAGRIQFMFDFPTTAIQPIKAGKLRGLAVTSAQRSPTLPDLPTVHEAGVKRFEFGTWAGILAPVGVSPVILNKLGVSFAKALQTPAVRDRMAEQAIQITPRGAQEFAAFIRADIDRWRQLLRGGHVAMVNY